MNNLLPSQLHWPTSPWKKAILSSSLLAAILAIADGVFNGFKHTYYVYSVVKAIVVREEPKSLHLVDSSNPGDGDFKLSLVGGDVVGPCTRNGALLRAKGTFSSPKLKFTLFNGAAAVCRYDGDIVDGSFIGLCTPFNGNPPHNFHMYVVDG
ncbi:MAG TPA: hypothetical protein PKY96_13735 [Flavobacteriales bacterium]|nr:hypothetical protein [Flavobacteriales bacterium]